MLAPLILLLAFAATPLRAEPTTSLQMVIHPPPELDSISLNEARSIFTMRVRAWPDGSPITVFVLNDRAPEHIKFVRSVLSLLPHQLRRQWDRMVYTGIGQAPIEVKDSEDMMAKLISTPGSIGYITTGDAHETLRIVRLR